MPYFFRRVLETLGFEIITSLVFASLFYFGILEQTYAVCIILMLVCLILNIIVLDIFLKGFLLSGFGDKEYYITNFTVLIILAALSIAFAGFNIEPLFTLLFLPFKLLHIAFGASKIVSAIIVSAVFFITAIIEHFLYKRFTIQ